MQGNIKVEINIVNEGVVLLRVSHRGGECDFFSNSLWKRIGLSTPNAIYGPLNEYLSTLPMTAQDNLYQYLLMAYESIESAKPLPEVKAELTDIVKNMYDVIDYNNLSKWVLTLGGIAYNSDIHETYTDDYPIRKRQTYLKGEYNELVILSFMFKLLTPIWGSFLRTYNTIDTDLKELEALDLMQTSMIHKIPAMIRLKDYCEALTEKYRTSGLTPAICTNMGTSEIPKYFLALAIVRRISISEIRDPDKTVIKIVYKFLESKQKSLSNGIRDKRGSRADIDEPESAGERYRISQHVPDHAIQMSSDYIMRIPEAVKRLNPGGSVPKVNGYLKSVIGNNSFSIANFHILITGLVCEPLLSVRSLRIMSRQPLLHAICVTAGWLSDNGYQVLANMLLASKSEKDPDQTDIYAAGGFSFKPLSDELKLSIDKMYPYREVDGKGKMPCAPGISMINLIIADINDYVWSDHNNVPMDIRDNIASLLVWRDNVKLEEHNASK